MRVVQQVSRDRCCAAPDRITPLCWFQPITSRASRRAHQCIAKHVRTMHCLYCFVSIPSGHNIRNSHGLHRNQGSSRQCRTRQTGNGRHRGRRAKRRPLRFASAGGIEPRSSCRLSTRLPIRASTRSGRHYKIRRATRIIIGPLAHFLSSGLMNGRPDARISAATAHHVRHRIVDILVAWLRLQL